MRTEGDPREKEKKDSPSEGDKGIPASPDQKEQREIDNPPSLDPGENPGPGEAGTPAAQ
jgi:hypothetical protein